MAIQVAKRFGSVPGRDFVKELPELAKAVAEGAFEVRARAVPLAEVEQAWTAAARTSDRIVLVPDGGLRPNMAWFPVACPKTLCRWRPVR